MKDRANPGTNISWSKRIRESKLRDRTDARYIAASPPVVATITMDSHLWDFPGSEGTPIIAHFPV